jgi:excinuclease ABC subunit A
MHFLPDVYVTCEECHGKRYNRETLEVKFKGMSIADVLDMTVEDAVEFFKAVPPIRDKMAMLAEVGLGYVKVGQQATTLSGGEAQRVKLAKELSRRATGHTLYILDEPTTGLHFEDVRKLLEVLHALVEQGNTVVVIEHNLDVIKTADWIIDLGPEGGVKGGEIVAQGTAEGDREAGEKARLPSRRADGSQRPLRGNGLFRCVQGRRGAADSRRDAMCRAARPPAGCGAGV